MPIRTQHPDGILIAAAGLNPAGPAGTVEVLNDDPIITESGWDVLRRRLLYTNAACLTATQAANLFDIGDKVDASTNAWVIRKQAKSFAAGVYTIDLVCHGLLETDRADKIRYSSAANQQSGENILDDSTPVRLIRPKLVTHESQVTCTRSYVQIGGDPPTDQVATELSSAEVTAATFLPNVKASIWDWLADPTYHMPNGWTFMDMDSDTIPGTEATTTPAGGVHLITERYQYIYPYSP